MVFDKQSNDCHFLKAKQTDNVLRVSFRRYFDTCDIDDYVLDVIELLVKCKVYNGLYSEFDFQSGTTRLVYATGTGSIGRVESLRLNRFDHGLQCVQLLKAVLPKQKPTPNVQTLELLNDNFTIPNVETTYWYTLKKLPSSFQKKTHIVRYEPVISEENLPLVN